MGRYRVAPLGLKGVQAHSSNTDVHSNGGIMEDIQTNQIIPKELRGLGKVFFPIPRGKKAWRYPHHLDAYRHKSDSDILLAYFESGWGYGIATAGPLAVVDIDELEFLREITRELPETVWQYSGSGEGVHLFYLVDNLDSRITLNRNISCGCPEDEIDNDKGKCESRSEDCEWEHIGEVKAGPHEYVVGPNSLHPSGNKYGPLQGDEITKLSLDELEHAISRFKKPEAPGMDTGTAAASGSYESRGDRHEFYDLTTADVLPWLGDGERIGHPVHGSETGANFMKQESNDIFMCWRCDYGSGDGCAFNAQQFLAIEETGMDCDDVRRWWKSDPTLHYKGWRRAAKLGLVDALDIPYKAVLGYAVEEGEAEPGDTIGGPLYHDMRQQLEWETMTAELPNWNPCENDTQ